MSGLASVASDATGGALETAPMPPTPDPTPSHPGFVLRERVLPGLGLSVLQAARDLGVCRQTLHRILAGTAAITPDMAARLARLTGVPGGFWLALQQAHDLARAEVGLAAILATIPAHTLPPTLAHELTAYGC